MYSFLCPDHHLTLLPPQLADAAKLKPLEMQLKKLEDLSEAIVQNFAYMREREEQMRDTNGERSGSAVQTQGPCQSDLYG